MTFKGIPLRVLAPEDQLLVKALVHKEYRSRHWFDALALVAAGGLDWDYLLWRAGRDPRRVLSLLLYAQADGLPVPDAAVRALFERATGAGRERQDGAGRERQDEEEPAAYLVGRVQERLAEDPRTAELEVDVRVERGEVVLSGNVATPERRAALADVVAAVLPGRPVRNLATAGTPAAPPAVEHLP